MFGFLIKNQSFGYQVYQELSSDPKFPKLLEMIIWRIQQCKQQQGYKEFDQRKMKNKNGF